VDAYTLYGSTICLVHSLLYSTTLFLLYLTFSPCQQNCQPSSTADGVNNAIKPSTPTTSPSTVSHPDDKYAATMPTGWSTSTPASYNKPRTTVILCVSLILAFFMCTFMTAFVIWRRKQRKPKEGDEEMRLRRRRGQELSEQETLMKKEARLKQKFWARASARWKANTQSSARRRKNRRLLAAVHSMSACDHSRPESSRRAPSRSSSTSPTPTSQTSLSSDRRSTHVDDHTTLGPSISTPNTHPVAPSPPAYIQRDSPPPTQSKRNHADEIYLRTDHDPPDPFLLIPRDTNDHEGHPEYTPSTDDVPIPYDDSYHAGHVATDDKTLLARMATMASAPPVEFDEGGSSTLQTSAPVWDDEQFEDIIDGLDDTEIGPSRTSSPPPSLPSTSHSPFPPPPSKGKMAAPDFYDYPYSFEEDVSTLEPEMGPSAPPFEEHTPSAPPLEEPEMMPSAPPLMPEFLPSAPDWEEGEGGQNHDREESPHHHSSRPPSPASISAISYSVLPSYHA
jgi:hypothetical protein